MRGGQPAVDAAAAVPPPRARALRLRPVHLPRCGKGLPDNTRHVIRPILNHHLSSLRFKPSFFLSRSIL